ncbi:polysaccharide deacetylase family protein [Acaryochloris sp. IP29b_bin.148]|uniref:polysaccharide deacetylase family protein n=1 Tax=Acaryochloris sp. IP29b_bin.148 TaxID=2969218 RepID=UPI00261B8A53|nr:polysaccharide deacetylase family protein [Acaryochloris sp. IP29b_bin.148]
MISVEVPQSYEPERRYILAIIFCELLGLELNVKLSDRVDTLITIDGENELIVADKLFSTPLNYWLSLQSLPFQPLEVWDVSTIQISPTLVDPKIPIIYGSKSSSENFFKIVENKIFLGLDIFGSTFFMLTRLEEAIRKSADQFSRFPAKASLAYQENFIDRPIVDEYVEILWACLQQLWPKLKRKPRNFKMHVSHDVDKPYQYIFTNVQKLIHNAVGDIVKRNNLRQSLYRVRDWTYVKYFGHMRDAFNTFEWLMTLNESYGLTGAFYFIADHTDSDKDGDYCIQHPLIRSLLRQIYQRGHEIGLHPSFNTYLDPSQTLHEFEVLRKVCSEENIQQEYWGGRQHYLRWQTPHTFQNCFDAGLSYDSTLGFADWPGFRCGTCYEYSVFNLVTRQALNLVERPLIVMECTVLDNRYMGLSRNIEEAYNYICALKNTCRLFNGDFNLLWHNHRFKDLIERDLYQQILAA